MGRICWGVEGAREELESITGKEEKIVLSVVELNDKADRFFYEVRMQPNVTVVEIGSGVKNCSIFDALSAFPDEYQLRRRISNILNTPDSTYKRFGEKVLAGLGLGEFSKPIEEKHLSPLDELLLVRSTLECAYTIGFGKIPFIGRTETSQNTLRQAMKELTERLKTNHSEAYRH
jgi:hypothetical protein